LDHRSTSLVVVLLDVRERTLAARRYGRVYQRRARRLMALTMQTAPRSILVGLGVNPDSRTLAVAADLARREKARLTVLAAVIRPPALIWASPFLLPYDPTASAQRDCEERLRTAVAALPADISVTALVRRRRVPAALLAELRTGAHDLVIVGGRRRRLVARILRRRGPVPVLVVDRRPSVVGAAPEPFPAELVAQGA
jgi:nucleotide-binding universal stress UspA family protein